jgi:Asp-tRNA(Asn)/Glu-tRNA(Gln) amidotransferase A subunit family amidase
MLYEMGRNYQEFFDDYHEHISKALLDMISEGRQISLEKYREAKETAVNIASIVDDILSPYDAVLTPATLSAAPAGLESTGSPIFCTIWSLCGVPAVSLPVLRGENQMPLGLQLVGTRGTDEKLIEGGYWIEQFFHSQKVD